METKKNFSANAKIAGEKIQKLSVKQRNMLLRRITDLIERKESLTEKTLSYVKLLFSTVKNFHGCEKCFYECIIAMHFSKDAHLMDIAKDFQNEINTMARQTVNQKNY